MTGTRHPACATLIVSFIVSALFATEAHAAWWLKALDAAGDASRAAAKASVAAGRRLHDIVKAHPPGPHPAHALRIADGKVIAADAHGAEVVVATASAGGALALTADGAALLRTAALVLSEDDLSALGELLKKTADTAPGRPIHLLRGDGTLGRVVVEEANGRRVLMAEKYAGVFLEVAALHADELAWALQQPVRTRKVRVMSLFHPSDADVLRRMDEALGELHQPGGHADPDAFTHALREQKQKTVFIVGHVEGDRFVVRDASGAVHGELPIAQLEAAAREADASVFMLGCSAAACSRSSGYLDAVNALHVADGLKEALRRPTFGEALSALSTGSGRMLVRPAIIGPLRTVMEVEQRMDDLGEHGLRALRFSTLASGRSRELSARIVPAIPALVQVPWFVGLFVPLFSLRPILADWAVLRLPAPRFGHRPAASVMVKGIRSLGFLLMMPYAAFLDALVLFVPWMLWLVVTLLYDSAAGIVAALFGLLLWRPHRHALAAEPWLRRFWMIPMFGAAVAFATFYCLQAFPSFAALAQDPQRRPLAWIMSALAASGLSYALLMLLRAGRWNPNRLLAWILSSPIHLIEIAARRLIIHPGTTSDQASSPPTAGPR
ncbi:hypothetical protein [Noviherbaspirillum denitrificans]|uniref:CHAT domain-containing protein n=1 Tax=Noviherbaspirillum denitrificans TaxID=1968433 RepID=A0A254T9T0_9BURK|nr:hypothetical protein [Noviherbaspirillum denitrificans]OWW19420.1 hypothetical protein AYR66_07760 [Noviherbaspirillum denitrificans]